MTPRKMEVTSEEEGGSGEHGLLPAGWGLWYYAQAS